MRLEYEFLAFFLLIADVGGIVVLYRTWLEVLVVLSYEGMHFLIWKHICFLVDFSSCSKNLGTN